MIVVGSRSASRPAGRIHCHLSAGTNGRDFENGRSVSPPCAGPPVVIGLRVGGGDLDRIESAQTITVCQMVVVFVQASQPKRRSRRAVQPQHAPAIQILDVIGT